MKITIRYGGEPLRLSCGEIIIGAIVILALAACWVAFVLGGWKPW